MASDDSEMLAQQVSGLNEKVASLEQRMADVEKVNARLEKAALTTARALQEISGHWDAVYEANAPRRDFRLGRRTHLSATTARAKVLAYG